ncbi:MAG: hypothetical protein KDK51_10285 [Deltaproteobacteria bacterium]|nr:hypothetical protein [Deltaproteobacteria bacterium]
MMPPDFIPIRNPSGRPAIPAGLPTAPDGVRTQSEHVPSGFPETLEEIQELLREARMVPERSGDTPVRSQAASEETDSNTWALPPVWLLILAVLPFWTVPAAHVISSPETATGLFEYEVPYYLANGRAIWSRGNGFSYPNPYDPDPAHPNLYFHWLLWGIGTATATFQLDPGTVWLGLTFFASLGFSLMTWFLVRFRLPGEHLHKTMFLLACWGGGLLSAAGLVMHLLTGTPSGHRSDLVDLFLSLDPGRGQWFLNWGRNSLLATEAVYHLLVAGAWLAEMRRRHVIGTVFAFLLATTHPWSGLELLLTVVVWRSYCRVKETRRDEQRSASVSLITAVVMLILFLGYYKVWLPSFEQHRQLQHVWELEWTLQALPAFLAYGLIAVPALVRVGAALRQWTGRQAEQLKISGDGDSVRVECGTGTGRTWSEGDSFLCCALAVAAGLSFHDRLIPAVQPIHFTRGYIWMPLFLLGLPVLTRWITFLLHGSLARRAVLIAVLIVGVFDNLTFLVASSQRQLHHASGFRLNTEERTLLALLNERCHHQMVLCDSESLNYLLPAYTDARPWLGHHFNTPSYPQRLQRKEAVFSGHVVHPELVPPEVEILAVNRLTDQAPLRHSQDWVPLRTPGVDWQVWQRTAVGN